MMKLTDDEQKVLVEVFDTCLASRDFGAFIELLEECRPDWPDLASQLNEREGFLEKAMYGRAVCMVLAIKYVEPLRV